MKEGGRSIGSTAVMSRGAQSIGSEGRLSVTIPAPSREIGGKIHVGKLAPFTPKLTSVAEGPVKLTPKTKFVTFPSMDKPAPIAAIKKINPIDFYRKGSNAPESNLKNSFLAKKAAQPFFGYRSEQNNKFEQKKDVRSLVVSRLREFIPETNSKGKKIDKVGGEFTGMLPQMKKIYREPQEIFVAKTKEIMRPASEVLLPTSQKKITPEVSLETKRIVADTKQSERVLTAWRSMVGEKAWQQESLRIKNKVNSIIEQKLDTPKIKTKKEPTPEAPLVVNRSQIQKLESMEDLKKKIQIKVQTEGLAATKEWFRMQGHPLPLEDIFQMALQYEIPAKTPEIKTQEMPKRENPNRSEEPLDTRIIPKPLTWEEIKFVKSREKEYQEPQIVCFWGSIGSLVNRDTSAITDVEVDGRLLSQKENGKVVLRGVVSSSQDTDNQKMDTHNEITGKEICMICLLVLGQKNLTLRIDTKTQKEVTPSQKEIDMAS